MKHVLAAMAVVACVLGALGTPTITDANGTLTIYVPSGESYNLSTHASGIAANSWTEIVKTGPGTLNGAGSFTTAAFTGTLTIREGYYYATSRDSLPNNTSAKAVVEGDSTGGGTLKIEISTSNFVWDDNLHLHLSGTGVNGTEGALRNLSSQAIQFYWVRLDADTLWHNATKQSQLRKSFDMQGHDITFTGGASDVTFFSKISNPGDIIANGSNVFRFNDQSQTHGLNAQGRPHRIYIRGDSYINCYKTKSIQTDWEIYCDHSSGGFYYPIRSSASGYSANETNRWTGSIHIDGGPVTNAIEGGAITGNSATRLHICEKGSISGPGAIYYTNQIWVHGTNTYGGATILERAAQVHFLDEKSIPCHNGYDDVFVRSGAIATFSAKTPGHPIGWGAQAWLDITRQLSCSYDKGWNSFCLEVPAGQTADLGGATLAGTGLDNRPWTQLNLTGGGTARATLTFQGAPFFTVCATNQTTSLEIATPGMAGDTLGMLSVQDMAHLVFKNAGRLTCTTNIQIYGNAANGETPRLTVSANSQMVRPTANKPAGIELAMLGNGRPNGTLEILAGGVVSNRLQSANRDNATGVLLVRSGGTFYQMGTSGEDTYSAQGKSSEAYYELEDGATMKARGTGIYSTGGSSGISLFNIKGGLWDHSSGTFSIGRETTGMVYQTGGTIKLGSQVSAFPSANYRRANGMGRSGFGSLTMEGSNTLFVSAQRVALCDRGYSRGQIDLNDGAALTALKVTKSLVQVWGSNANNGTTDYYQCPVDTTAYVGFNGGILRAAGNATDFLGDPSESYNYGSSSRELSGTGDSRPDYVTVYAGGATLDASNFNVTVHAPIVQPGAGKSVTALAIPAGADMTGYIAAPIVQISGDGHGALAMALYDSTNGVVTGVKVVSPGWGYTTATANLIRGGKETPVALTVTLAEADRTGGLTVAGGTGTVTLAAANTYGGPTTTAGGTLKVAHANAIPAGSEIRLGNGVLDMNGFAIPSGCTVKIADPAAYESRSNTVVVARNLVELVTVANANELPPNWYVEQSGSILKFVFNIGTCIIFR